jgi:predicted metal-dependent phosphoesterase TrpH
MGRHATPGPGDPEAPPQPPHPPALADFHTHTLRSDGVLEPRELVRQVAETPVRTLAITDHDNLAGAREVLAAGAPPGVTIIPGVEINSLTTGMQLPEGELHIIGLGVDPAHDELEAALRGQRDARRARFHRTIDRFRELGMPIDAQVADLDPDADDALGRPTVARALVAAGYAESVEDAFGRWLGWGMPGYVGRTGLGPFEAIRVIRAAGGLPVLAHFWSAPDRVSLLRDLIAAGLGGIETHHRSFDVETKGAISAVARALRLVPSGGTDYHGDLGPYAMSHAELVLPEDVRQAMEAALAETAAD